METFLHLSIPVTELDAALTFYVDTLGCAPGRIRREQGFADVWFYGMQLTLQEQPEQVLPLEQQGSRHFGAALPPDELAGRVGATRCVRRSPGSSTRPSTPTDG